MKQLTLENTEVGMIVTPAPHFDWYDPDNETKQQAEQGEYGVVVCFDNEYKAAEYAQVRWNRGYTDNYPLHDLLGETEFEHRIRLANAESDTDR